MAKETSKKEPHASVSLFCASTSLSPPVFIRSAPEQTVRKRGGGEKLPKHLDFVWPIQNASFSQEKKGEFILPNVPRLFLAVLYMAKGGGETHTPISRG